MPSKWVARDASLNAPWSTVARECYFEDDGTAILSIPPASPITSYECFGAAHVEAAEALATWLNSQDPEPRYVVRSNGPTGATWATVEDYGEGYGSVVAVVAVFYGPHCVRHAEAHADALNRMQP